MSVSLGHLRWSQRSGAISIGALAKWDLWGEKTSEFTIKKWDLAWIIPRNLGRNLGTNHSKLDLAMKDWDWIMAIEPLQNGFNHWKSGFTHETRCDNNQPCGVDQEIVSWNSPILDMCQGHGKVHDDFLVGFHDHLRVRYRYPCLIGHVFETLHDPMWQAHGGHPQRGSPQWGS